MTDYPSFGLFPNKKQTPAFNFDDIQQGPPPNAGAMSLIRHVSLDGCKFNISALVMDEFGLHHERVHLFFSEKNKTVIMQPTHDDLGYTLAKGMKKSRSRHRSVCATQFMRKFRLTRARGRFEAKVVTIANLGRCLIVDLQQPIGL